MFQIDLKSRKPIYEQVVDGFKLLIVSNILKPDDKVPSVREMAKALTVNPNTVQKAYRELENQGYIYTTMGLGSFISQSSQHKDENKKARLFVSLDQTVNELRFVGVTREEIANHILDGGKQ